MGIYYYYYYPFIDVYNPFYCYKSIKMVILYNNYLYWIFGDGGRR